MSDHGAEVGFASDAGGREQFGKTLTYHNGAPKRRRIVWVSVGVIMLVTAPAIFFGPPSKSTVVTSADIFTIPAVTPSNQKLDLPVYTRADDLRAQEQSSQTQKTVIVRRTGKPEKLVGPQLLKRPRNVKIPPGAMVKARLLSGASNGLIKAEIKEALVVAGETLVEAGTVAVGSGSSSDSRLYIKFDKLVFRDGTVDSVQAEGADNSDKTVGLKGSKVGYQALRLAAGIGLNVAGGAAAVLQETEGQQGAVITKPTMKNAMLGGAGKASIDQSKEMMQALKNEAPVIEIPEGQDFYILFSGSEGGG